MMMKSQSKPMRRLAILAMPAMAAIAIVALSQPGVANVLNRFTPAETERIDSVSEGKVSDNPTHVQVAVENEPIRIVGVASYKKDTPQSTPVFFVDGKRFEGDINSISPAEIKSMKVIQDNPDYPEGLILISTKAAEQPVATSSEEKVFFESEQLPEFQGGMGALMSFIGENIRYPEGVTLTKPERSLVQFTIGKDGSVSDVQLMKSAGVEALDQEAIRVVKATSGKWTPGKDNGTPVAVKFTLPVTFASKA